MAGTDAEFEIQVEDRGNVGDAIISDASRDAVERRLQDFLARANGGGGNNHIVSLRRFLVQLWIFAANHGTGKRTYWEGKEFQYRDQTGVIRTALAEWTWDVILSNPHGVGNQAFPFPKTVKAYFRKRATTIIRCFKKNMTLLTRWQRMGLPQEYAYLGADYFDAANVLNEEEAAVVDAAKQVQLFRSNRNKQLNTSVQYTGASASTNAGAIQSNAKRLLLE